MFTIYYLNNFILSKGHGCLAFYAMLFHSKKISKKVFFSFCKKDSILGGHPDMNKSKYITASTGSLGHGLPIISGMVFADNLSNIKKNYYIILGDQECLEGTTWETMFILNKFKLNKLTIIIDRNFSRDDAIPLGNLKKKLSGKNYILNFKQSLIITSYSVLKIIFNYLIFYTIFKLINFDMTYIEILILTLINQIFEPIKITPQNIGITEAAFALFFSSINNEPVIGSYVKIIHRSFEILNYFVYFVFYRVVNLSK